MSESRRRLLLALAVFLPVAGATGLALGVAREAAVEGAEAALRSEVATAAALHGELAGTEGVEPGAALDALYSHRWRLAAGAEELLDRPEVRAEEGLRVARTTLYGPDGWTRVGTLELRAAASPPRLPVGVVLGAGAALLVVLALLLWSVAGRGLAGLPPRRRRAAAAALAVLAVALVAWPPWRAAGWAVSELRRADEARMAGAVAALDRLPDPASFARRPGAVTRLTGLSSVVLDPGGGVASTTMLAGRAERVAALPSPPPRRTRMDRAPLAVREAGPVRLTAVPYSHTMDPRPEMAGWGLAGLLLAGLPLLLLPVVEHGRRLRENLTAWSFLAPAGLHLLVFTLGPLAFAAWLSLHRWSLVDAARPFVGLANYAGLLGDGAFWNAIGNTALFTLHVPVAMAVALGFALLVRGRTARSRWARTALFLPSITSLVAIAIVWQWMLNDQYGLINWLLTSAGLPPVGWLTDPDVALWSLMLLYVWLIVGYQMVLFQAGLAAIPEQLYDAAEIDGAGPWRRFVHVTLPGLRHTLFFVLVTSVIGSFQVFGAVYVMTEGGPLGSTDVAVFHIYREAWEFLRFGNAAAMSWVLFAILFVVTWLHFRLLERRTAGGAA